MGEWWSIEVFHGEFQASHWRDMHSNALIESAVSHGAIDWVWHEHRWGVVFEVEFPEDAQWEVFRGLPAVRAALDAVPDPVNGLLVYRGRGGGSGATSPRHPRPVAGAGAVSLPEPDDDPQFDLTAVRPAGLSDTAAQGVTVASAQGVILVADGVIGSGMGPSGDVPYGVLRPVR